MGCMLAEARSTFLKNYYILVLTFGLQGSLSNVLIRLIDLFCTQEFVCSAHAEYSQID